MPARSELWMICLCVFKFEECSFWSLIYCFSMIASGILVWNVRGLNMVARRDAVRDVVLSSNADIVCLQETKLSISPRLLLAVLGSDFDQHVAMHANYTRGGTIIVWKGAVC